MHRAERDRERTVLALLEELLELPESRRAVRLEERCAGDGELRARVLELLPLHRDLGPAPWAAWVDGAEPRPGLAPAAGAWVGSYEVVRAIATGAMGRVYEARQASPDRRVALKILRLELGSDEMEQRFRYESELLARLRHPGIATVYEAGVDGDVPWMALEYVAGARPIDAFAAEEGLGVRAVAELFLQVLDAVQHGHQRGVIHRDVKPANVLVDRAGRVKLIDFGVARAVGGARDALTLHGELVGTVSYMSPEQADGSDDVDAQSDVYSLGVVLYELLCGRRPHDLEGLSVSAAARALVERDPVRPRARGADLARDLEAVLSTALERDRGRRYRSAAAFADDLRAYLAGRPVAARPPGVGRRAALFARRNPALVASLGLTAVALVAATGVSLRFAWDERAARREAEAARRSALDQSFALVTEFAPRLADLEGSLDVRRALIQEAADRLQQLAGSLGDEVAVRRRVALAHVALGDVLGNPLRDNLGDREGAEARYRRALAVLEPGGDALPGVELDAARARLRLAQLALHAGRPGDALPPLEDFLALQAGVWAGRDGSAALGDEFADTLVHAGTAHGLLGDHERALERFERALEVRRSLLERHPGDPERELDVSVALSKVGSVRWRQGDGGGVADLEEALERAAAVVERAPSVPRYRRTLVETATLLSDVLVQDGAYARAQEALDVARRESASLRGSDPDNAFYRRQWGQITYNQGWLLRERGRRERADGSARWRATLADAADWLGRSRDAWAGMEERGELEPRERGHVARIDREIRELEGELLPE